MSDTINLLPEDMQAKGFIPKPEVEPASQSTEILKEINNFNKANGIVNDVNVPEKNNSVFEKNENIAPMPQKPILNLKKAPAPAPVKASFWNKLLNSKKTNFNLGAKTVGGGLNGVGSVSLKKFSIKSILKWLTANSNSNDNDDQEDFGINLVQTEAETIPPKTIFLKIFLRILPALIIILATYFIAHFYSSNIKAKTEAMVQELSTTVKISDEDVAKLESNASGVDRKVSVMRNIFDRHIYWTRLLDFLEESFVGEVYIKTLTAENSGNLVIQAQTDSFTSVAKQYLAFQTNPNIKEVSITGADKSGDEDVVTFSVRLKIWPGIMYPNAYLNKVLNK